MDDTSTLILDRLLQGAGLRRDSQLAEVLGVSPQAVSQARRKGRIPDGWAVRVAARFHLSMDWVYFGHGSPVAQEIPSTGNEPAAPPAPLPAAAPAEAKKPGRHSAAAARSAGRPERGPRPSSGPTRAHELTRYTAAHPPASAAGMFSDADPEAAQDEPNIDLALVPLVSARLAAGPGSLMTDADVNGYFAFRQDWLCRKGNPDRMVLMKVFGDSMEPDIRHGDMVLVNQANTQIYGHAIYAVGVNEEIYIKQVETLPGGRLVLRSLNERYEPIVVSLHGDLADSVRIIGRVIWWCREA